MFKPIFVLLLAAAACLWFGQGLPPATGPEVAPTTLPGATTAPTDGGLGVASRAALSSAPGSSATSRAKVTLPRISAKEAAEELPVLEAKVEAMRTEVYAHDPLLKVADELLTRSLGEQSARSKERADAQLWKRNAAAEVVRECRRTEPLFRQIVVFERMSNIQTHGLVMQHFKDNPDARRAWAAEEGYSETRKVDTDNFTEFWNALEKDSAVIADVAGRELALLESTNPLPKYVIDNVRHSEDEQFVQMVCRSYLDSHAPAIWTAAEGRLSFLKKVITSHQMGGSWPDSQ